MCILSPELPPHAYTHGSGNVGTGNSSGGRIIEAYRRETSNVLGFNHKHIDPGIKKERVEEYLMT